MDLNLTPKLRRRETADAGRTANASGARKELGEPMSRTEKLRQSREDRVELSQEALEFLKAQNEPAGPAEKEAEEFRTLTKEEQRQLAKADQRKFISQALAVVREQTAAMQEQSKKQTDALKESLDKMKKCAKIAHSISKGRKVPPKDEKYLLENDPKAYMMAMALRMLEEQDNKKVKSVLDDEDQQNEAETAAPSVPEPSIDSGAEADIPVE